MKTKTKNVYSDWDNIFDDFNKIFTDESLFNTSFNSKTVEYKVINQKGDDLVFELPVIGNDPADVSVSAEDGNKLRVKAKKGESSFSKEIDAQFIVPDTHKNNAAKAVILNGILTVSIPKRKSSKKTEIEIEY